MTTITTLTLQTQPLEAKHKMRMKRIGTLWPFKQADFQKEGHVQEHDLSVSMRDVFQR